jgi:thymidine phosphorylase
VAARSGTFAGVDTKQVGLAVVDLGGGRLAHTDEIDLSVGLEYVVRVGQKVEAGQPLFRIRCRDEARAERARQRLLSTIRIVDGPVERQPLLLRHCED